MIAKDRRLTEKSMDNQLYTVIHQQTDTAFICMGPGVDTIHCVWCKTLVLVILIIVFPLACEERNCEQKCPLYRREEQT